MSCSPQKDYRTVRLAHAQSCGEICEVGFKSAGLCADVVNLQYGFRDESIVQIGSITRPTGTRRFRYAVALDSPEENKGAAVRQGGVDISVPA